MADELVLIIEDNERNLKLVRDVLQHDGYRTLEARSGAEGVALASERRPDIVLMDVQLPDFDGLEALRRIRSAVPAVTSPVVAVTAFAMAEDRERILAAGFDGYLAKPVSVRDLPAQVRAFLQDGRAP